jgi:hypothetical protein
VFENKGPRRVFGQEEELTGGPRIVHNEELHILYSLLNTVKVIK